jgi:hypothetical protein
VIGGSIVGAIVIGAFVAFLGQAVYLIIIFPLLMGIAGGIFSLANVLRFDIQRRSIAILIGIGLGALIYISYRYSDYLLFIRTLSSAKSLAFFDYLRLSAALGTTVGAGVSALRVPFGETATWVYWLVEALLVIGLSAYIAQMAASKPAVKVVTTP